MGMQLSQVLPFLKSLWTGLNSGLLQLVRSFLTPKSVLFSFFLHLSTASGGEWFYLLGVIFETVMYFIGNRLGCCQKETPKYSCLSKIDYFFHTQKSGEVFQGQHNLSLVGALSSYSDIITQILPLVDNGCYIYNL